MSKSKISDISTDDIELLRALDHGTHIRDIELELKITDTFMSRQLSGKNNPSLKFWHDLLNEQDQPISLTLNKAWVQSVSEELDFEGREPTRFVTRVRLVGKILTTKGGQ